MTRAFPLLLAILLAACTTSSPAPTVAPSSMPSSAPTSTVQASAPPIPAPGTTTPTAIPEPSTAASCAETTLASLTEAQRIGQLFAVGLAKDRFDATARDAVAHSHIGSWWFTEKTDIGVDAVRAVSDAVQAASTEASTGGVGAFVAANQEGGLIQALSGPGFDRIPSAVTQGTWPAATLNARATRWGRELLDAGVNLDFAPVADVVPKGTERDNAPIGELKREYGSDPTAVARSVAAFIDGMHAAGVATTAKHFPGLGRVASNTDFATGVVDSITTPDDPYLTPFRRAVDHGVPAVMMSLATYERIDPDRLAAFSWPTIGGILEDDLGFTGIVMSDSLSAEAVSSIPAGTRAVAFLDDGGDMIVVNPVDVAVDMVKAVAAHARESDWFRRRIDNAALHVLRAKDAVGLLPCSG